MAPVQARSPAAAALTQPAGAEEPAVAATQPSANAPFRFFSASSFWNTPVAGASVDPGSRELIGSLESEIAREDSLPGGPSETIDTTSYSVPIYTVAAGQPTVPVVLEGTPHPTLSAAWSSVPIPAGAQPASGTDGDLVVWQPSRDRMWEFWRAVHESNGWHARWGGAIQHVSANAGVYDTEAWPGATPWWGVTASSLAVVGGLVTFEDLAAGKIDHALAVSIPNVRAAVFAAPAQRTDGTSASPLALPEGTHLRLDPSLDLGALHLPPLTLLLAQAAQRYGIFVRDRSPNVDFYAQDPTPLGLNPYVGPGGFFRGRSANQLAAAFPWSHLEVLTAQLRSSP